MRVPAALGAAVGITAAALALSVAGASTASAGTPPPQDEQIITYDVCMIRGNGFVASGDIQGFTCTTQPDGTAILHWW